MAITIDEVCGVLEAYLDAAQSRPDGRREPGFTLPEMMAELEQLRRYDLARRRAGRRTVFHHYLRP